MTFREFRILCEEGKCPIFEAFPPEYRSNITQLVIQRLEAKINPKKIESVGFDLIIRRFAAQAQIRPTVDHGSTMLLNQKGWRRLYLAVLKEMVKEIKVELKSTTPMIQ